MDAKHSRIAPSSAGVWVKCPGSVSMKESCPELPRETNHHDEGDAAHWLAAQWLQGNGVAVGSKAPNGFIITEEMASYVYTYMQDVIKYSTCIELHIEETIHVPHIHAESWGSVDTWCFDLSDNTIYIWDFKYGYGIVEVFENWQLLNYAIGLIDIIIKAEGMLDTELFISMRIAQPRPGHRDGPVREWLVKASDLRGYANHLEAAALEALGSDPTITSGEHCKYCSARSACPAAHKAAMSAVDYSMQAGIDRLSPEAISDELRVLRRAADAIKYRLTGLEAEAMSQIKNGDIIPGWTLDSGLGIAKWSRPIGEIFTLGDMLGKDLRKKPAAITPSQAKKLGVDKATVDAYSIRETAALKLVPSDDTMAARVFGGKEG